MLDKLIQVRCDESTINDLRFLSRYYGDNSAKMVRYLIAKAASDIKHPNVTCEECQEDNTCNGECELCFANHDILVAEDDMLIPNFEMAAEPYAIHFGDWFFVVSATINRVRLHSAHLKDKECLFVTHEQFEKLFGHKYVKSAMQF